MTKQAILLTAAHGAEKSAFSGVESSTPKMIDLQEASANELLGVVGGISWHGPAAVMEKGMLAGQVSTLARFAGVM